MKTEDHIIKSAVHSLEKQTGFSILTRKADSSDTSCDYELEIRNPQDNGDKVIKILAEVKLRINDAVIGNLAIHAKNSSRPTLLVTEYVNPQQAATLRGLNLQFFDTVGNAYLKCPGLYVFVSGNKSHETKSEKPIGLFRPAGIKLLLAFLTRPGMENTDYRTIALDTGVPRTTVGELMTDLERSGYLRRRGDSRLLVNKSDLIRRWVETYSEKFKVKLEPVRYHSTKHTGRWWEKVDISEYKAVWGGETGGALLIGHLRPQTATIYADSKLTRFQAVNGLIKDEKGEIEILQRFWKFGEIGKTAPPLVLYADLVATADERNLETAKLIYDEYLAPIAEGHS